jgi:hypothetical protein
MRTLQREQDHTPRAMNLENYFDTGTVNKGAI